MTRTLAVLAFLAAGLGSAIAQDTPAATTPDPASVTIDPAASIDATPRTTNLLTGLYATRAVIEICNVSVDEAVNTNMLADQGRLERQLTLDEASATEAYNKVRADVQSTNPDCAEGSSDRASVDAVTNIYAEQVASEAAAGSTGATAAPAAQ